MSYSNPNDLCCPAGCFPCGDDGYWTNGGVHSSECCQNTQCSSSTNERLTRTMEFVRSERRRGSSVRASGALTAFAERTADPMDTWLGADFEQDVADWVTAESEWSDQVERWLVAETDWDWLDAEQTEDVKASEEDVLLASLRAKAEQTRAGRVVHLARPEAAPGRVHTAERVRRHG
jgi:hypothetical protein